MTRLALPLTAVEATAQGAMELARGAPATSPAASATTLMEGALRAMFWGKLKVLTASVVCGAALLAGSAAIGRRALGFPGSQTGSAEPKTEPRAGQGGGPLVPFGIFFDPASLQAKQRARLSLVTQIRDSMLRLFREGESNANEYLQWEKRYHEIAAETAQNDAERLRAYEASVSSMKQIEAIAGALYKSGQIKQSDVLVVELERVEAEIALEKFKARMMELPAAGDIPKR